MNIKDVLSAVRISVLFVIMIIFVSGLIVYSLAEQVTARTKVCAESNKTYVHVTLIEGLHTKIDYCGDLEQLRAIVKELNSVGVAP